MKRLLILAFSLIFILFISPGFAATISKTWKGEATLVSTNAYGGGTADLAADQAYDYTSDVDLETNGYQCAVISLEYDSAGTTDNIIISVFGSTDGGSTYDDNEVWSQQVDATSGNDEQISFVICDYPHFRLGVKTSGTTDTFDYRIMWDAWRWSSD